MAFDGAIEGAHACDLWVVAAGGRAPFGAVGR